MFASDDTIVAIATPVGRGGIGVVRVSGPAAVQIAEALLANGRPLRPRHATFARAAGDQVVATYFPAPHSYTGEDVVEVSAHGSPIVLREIVQHATQAGARLAEPGEFTLRAFLNSRIDLIQAEAVADLIDAVTPLQARAAFDQLDGTLTGRIAEIDAELFDLIARVEASLDFPDEGYHFVRANEAAGSLRDLERKIAALVCDSRRGRLIRDGARVTIAGRPNVGKSSLFNALLGVGRAIVTPVAGTTRDLLTETADIDGLRLELVDTAGIRDAADAIEEEGVARARRAWQTADLVLVVLDGSEPLQDADLELLREIGAAPHLVVVNKADLPARWEAGGLSGEPGSGLGDKLSGELGIGEPAIVSSKTGAGLAELRDRLRSTLDGIEASAGVLREPVAVTNVRHALLLERAGDALRRACESVETPGGPVPEEFVLTDLQAARAALEEVTGKRTSDDLLRHIFSRFCIGK